MRGPRGAQLFHQETWGALEWLVSNIPAKMTGLHVNTHPFPPPHSSKHRIIRGQTTASSGGLPGFSFWKQTIHRISRTFKPNTDMNKALLGFSNVEYLPLSAHQDIGNSRGIHSFSFSKLSWWQMRLEVVVMVTQLSVKGSGWNVLLLLLFSEAALWPAKLPWHQ